MHDRKSATFILAGLAAIVAVAGILFYQMAENGQPTPPENAPIAAQGR